MSTTVVYDGSEIVTAENETVTLKTAGTYMVDDVTVTDTPPSDVPFIINIVQDENEKWVFDCTYDEIQDALYQEGRTYYITSNYGCYISQDLTTGGYTTFDGVFVKIYMGVYIMTSVEESGEVKLYTYFVGVGLDNDDNNVNVLQHEYTHEQTWSIYD